MAESGCIQYSRVELLDLPEQSISDSRFQGGAAAEGGAGVRRTGEFLRAREEEGSTVLVHCNAGVGGPPSSTPR